MGERAYAIHLRGLHYLLVSGEVAKPNGLPYTNTDRDWMWMSEDCAKAARWLGYLPWEQVRDARSSEPEINRHVSPHPSAYLHTEINVEIPDAAELEPHVGVFDFVGVQPYKLVLFGEKTSLADVLGLIADRHAADLYLPAGEISDSFLFEMARTGDEDGRPMIVLTVSDCDPAGWQMPISIARKLQSFNASLFPDLDFCVYRVGLLPEHVRTHGLPSTPLKETERRADRWRTEMGVEQTEIDALAALRPELLERLVEDAIAPFFDSTLDRRVREAKAEWLAQAEAQLEEQIDVAERERIQKDATEKLDQLRDEIDAINDALHIDPGAIELPEIVIPEADVAGPAEGNGLPLLDSGWSWIEQTQRLIASKAYTDT